MSNFDFYQKYWDKKFDYFVDTEGWDHGRDDVPRGDVIYNFINLLDIQNNNKILDIGCGHGRLFEIYLKKTKNIFGCDISKKMISFAKQKYSFLDENLSVQNIEDLKYDKESFDRIICYGVFDGILNQKKALNELARVLKKDALLLLSGKHKPYEDKDSEALYAEKKAEEAGHPNVFSSLQELYEQFQNKFNIQHELFFQMRGDMAIGKYTETPPEKFYEFIFILKKI